MSDQRKNPIKLGFYDRANGQNQKKKFMSFFKNQNEKAILVKFFMIEGETDFELLSLRGKMNRVAECGDTEFQNWYYEKGIVGDLQTEWKNLNQM